MKRLQGIDPPEYRLRTGDYRARFHQEGETIRVLRVRNRLEAYRWTAHQGIDMGYEAKKTEHSGPKRGSGAYWGYKRDAEKESNRARRTNWHREIRNELAGASDGQHER